MSIYAYSRKARKNDEAWLVNPLQWVGWPMARRCEAERKGKTKGQEISISWLMRLKDAGAALAGGFLGALGLERLV